jgi:hypothetical protein
MNSKEQRCRRERRVRREEMSLFMLRDLRTYKTYSSIHLENKFIEYKLHIKYGQ